MFKNFVFSILAIIMVVSPFQIHDENSNQLDFNLDAYRTDLNVENRAEIEMQHQIQLEAQLREMGLLDEIGTRGSTVQNEVRTVRNRTQQRWTGYRRAGNQTPGGHRFNSIGSGFMFDINGGGMANISMSFSFGPVGISLSQGNANAGVRGVLEAVPSNLIGVPVFLEVNRLMERREYRIYTRPRGATNAPWTFSQTTYTHTVITPSTRVVRAN